MYAKSDVPQWSVHTEVIISHNDGVPLTTSHSDQDGSGVRMIYTWTTNPTNETNAESSIPTVSTNNSSENASRSSNNSYGFQRGNMVFTTSPPRRPYNIFDANRLGVNVHDSGYSSEHLLSPNNNSSSSYAPSNLPRKPVIPYNRRCRSTCSIILSTDFNAEGHNVKCDAEVTQPPYHQCGRTQSLRCQTPTIRPDKRDSYYGCGDPWCYHAEDANRRCSPVPESCEDCSISNPSVSSKRPSRANTFTTHFCTRVPERNKSSPPHLGADFRSRDMTTQTVETKEKCTSPLEKMTPPFKDNKSDTDSKSASGRKKTIRKRSAHNSRKNSDSNSPKNKSPVLLSPDSAENKKSSKRIVRSPAMSRGISPMLERKNNSPKDPDKKPRTVHIDVYCTGSDGDSDSSSSSSSDEEVTSSPQTVYESGKLRVSHRKAGSSELPYSLQNFINDNNIPTSEKQESNLKIKPKNNSDSEDEQSTAYPSAQSSYSTIRDLNSSMSSVPASWSALSLSSCTVPDGYDSIAATSCKDTVSDFESFIQGKLSLAPTESDYFIPRRLKIEHISSDTPVELNRDLSDPRIIGSDSFDYADSADRDRIQTMEQMWAGDPNQKTWKSPQTERKHLLQRQKLQEYLDKRLKQKAEIKQTSKEIDSESAEDDSEQGWTFVRSEDGKSNLKRDTTVRKTSKDSEEIQQKKEFSESAPVDTGSNLVQPKNIKDFSIKQNQIEKIPAKKQPVGFESSSRTPFTIVPGIFTNQLYKAQKFGTIIGAVRKPGHHVGPAKNPDCLCEHCKRYCEEYSHKVRCRTRSMGDPPTEGIFNWRGVLKSHAEKEVSNFSDF